MVRETAILKLRLNPITDDTIYVFNSMYEAFKKTGVNFGAISNVIKGKGRIAGGYKWIKI